MCLALDSCNLLTPPSMGHVPSSRARPRAPFCSLTVATHSSANFPLPRRYVYPLLRGRSWCVFRAGRPLLALRSRTGTCTDWWDTTRFSSALWVALALASRLFSLHAHLSPSASKPSSCPFDFLVVAAASTFCAAALVLSLWMLILARPDLVARLAGLPSSSRCPHRQPSFASPCWCPRLGPRRRTGCLVDDLISSLFFLLRFLASIFYSTGGVTFIGTV